MVSTKTRVLLASQSRSLAASPEAVIRSSRKFLLSRSSTQTTCRSRGCRSRRRQEGGLQEAETAVTFWVMLSLVEPTLPTARKTYSLRKSRASICEEGRSVSRINVHTRQI